MPTQLNWITDRLPTEADADAYGDVVVGLRFDAWEMERRYNVPESSPWIAFKPPSTDPAPVTTAPALTASQPRRIISLVEADSTVMAVADDGTAWFLSSNWSNWTQLPALPEQSSS